MAHHEVTTSDISIKKETNNPDDLVIHIKPESDYEGSNPFENVQLQIKQELDGALFEVAQTEAYPVEAGDLQKCSEFVTNSKIGIKNETVADAMVSYDYPTFDDTGSMDSNEATALGNVEACLHDEVDIKVENECYEDHEKQEKVKVKDELDLTVTETHLISNKVFNSTSTVTNSQHGLIESQTTKTVMEIHPMMQAGIASLQKITPEEILPTPYEFQKKHPLDYEETFQLNSITGNVLSLEQEAYDILKTKRKTNLLKLYYCQKCPKICKSSYCLKSHMRVHETIENRAMGIIKGRQTRIENQRKRQDEEIFPRKKRKRELDLKTQGIVKARNARIEKRNKLRNQLEENRKFKTEQKPDNKFHTEDKPVVETKQEMKKEGYECTCGQVFQRRSRMETCLRSHNMCEEIISCFSCVTCSKQFKDKDELILHRRRLHRKRFPCKFCPTDYNTRKELFKHLQAHQKVQLMEYKVISEVVKGKQKLRCFMCAKTCSELSELKSHVMDDHKEPYICPHCKDTFPKIIDFGNHTKTYHPEVEGQSVLDVLEAFSKLVKAWKCEECELQFHEADKLALHQLEKHSRDLKSLQDQFQCADCRRVFISQKGLTSHRRVHHNTETTSEVETEESGVMCVECRKICKDMTALTSHMRLHSMDRKYPCKFCDFRFATPEKRKAHAELHTGDMKYVCFICEYQCSSENRLKQHKISLKHVNMKELLLTGKPLLEEEQSTSKREKSKERKKESESKKKRMEESEQSEEATCDICGDKFPSESEMLEHKQTHPFIEFPNEDTPTRIFFK